MDELGSLWGILQMGSPILHLGFAQPFLPLTSFTVPTLLIISFPWLPMF